MYAIIETGGKQYKVENGDVIFIEKLDVEADAEITFDKVIAIGAEDGLKVGASLEDLGKNLRSQVGTMFATRKTGPRYLEMTEGYVETCAVDKDGAIIGYNTINFGKFMDAVKDGVDPKEAMDKARTHYGRVTKEDGMVKLIDPRKE